MPELIDIRPLLPEARFDLRYTTDNNVLGRPLHNDQRVLLREDAAEKLVYATKLFVACSVVPVIWDTFRTIGVQKMLIEFNNDPKYVLSPDKSNHPKGLAVDMTLAYPDGRLMDMGTDFDDFSDLAHLNTLKITKAQRANRMFLGNIMRKAGFVQLPTEWWHFDFAGESKDLEKAA